MKKTKKNRLICLILAVVLVLASLPVTVFGASSNPTRTTPLTLEQAGTTDNLATEGWKWELGEDYNTLIFQDFYLKSDATKLLTLPNDKPVYIVSNGTNIIETTQGAFSSMITGANGNADYVFEGAGSLELRCSNNPETTDCYGLAGRQITINSSDIISNVGFCIIKEDVTINGGSLTINAGENSQADGIYTNEGNVTINDGKVDITVGRVGIYIPGVNTPQDAELGVHINGGDVKINATGGIDKVQAFGISAKNVIIDTKDTIDVNSYTVGVYIADANGALNINSVGPNSKFTVDPESKIPLFYGVKGYAQNIASADYSKVEEVIANAQALNKDEYVDFNAVDEAIAAVNRDKNILEQDQVDAMANAITQAVNNLELKKDPTAPTDPTDPVDPTTPTNPTDPTDPVDPPTPTNPTDPTDPVDPPTPTNPTDPTDPVDPPTPTNPTDQNAPTDPTTQGSSNSADTDAKSPATGAGVTGIMVSSVAFCVAAVLNKKRNK